MDPRTEMRKQSHLADRSDEVEPIPFVAPLVAHDVWLPFERLGALLFVISVDFLVLSGAASELGASRWVPKISCDIDLM